MDMYSHYYILVPNTSNIKRPADLQILTIFGTAGLIDFHLIFSSLCVNC